MASGEWRYWFGEQPYYQRTSLPGLLVVCADGDGANVRTAPSRDANVITALVDLTDVTAGEFILTEPGSYSLGTSGTGWYRLRSPTEGWIYSSLLADARTQGCSLRDALVNQTP